LERFPLQKGFHRFVRETIGPDFGRCRGREDRRNSHLRLVDRDICQLGLPIAGLDPDALHRCSCGRRLRRERSRSAVLEQVYEVSSLDTHHLCLLQGSECRMTGATRTNLCRKKRTSSDLWRTRMTIVFLTLQHLYASDCEYLRLLMGIPLFVLALHFLP
jgi:hypothetical protein